MINPSRVTTLKKSSFHQGPVIYWMSRDQRVKDNWALLYAMELAQSLQQPLVTCFCLVPSYLNARESHYSFMTEGLMQVRLSLQKNNVPFVLLNGDPSEEIVKLSAIIKAGAIVTDFNPLRINREWKDRTAKLLAVPFFEVDAHNIIPCTRTSTKAEFSARTIRPKIQALLPDYLTEFPKPVSNPYRIDIPSEYSIFPEVKKSPYMPSGEEAAIEQLRDFLENRLNDYPERRNHPEENGQSGLSPYLHFGQISAQRIALEVREHPAPPEAKAAFLEELIVRRELSDNFCFYNTLYDSFDGFQPWAKRTLNDHRSDPRPFRYTLSELENAASHDEAWNAAQREMVNNGKMHGYMRMYWAKKILEWTETPEEALAYCIHLNDRYSLDGRDPNGYAGIAWSVGGTHDRAWNERPVFGKIRYMNYNGLRRKFHLENYIRQHQV